MYSLTYSKEGFIFIDTREYVFLVYKSYYDLLKSVWIEGRTIEEIIAGNLYSDLSIY
ncbi:hypothetical protein [uncultured Anaerococcus sp.]|uniref:hypothetical protein n=1 Tax=uncultured Anaerococcus sp. TaxID=293428 RepID=UPI002602DFAB|nr:hypothetical protein [uncultured Anaerococcus sp.]